MFINLKSFAEHSQKIPSTFLAPDVKDQSGIPLYKVFVALFIDMTFIGLVVAYMATMVIMTINAQFLPPKLYIKSLPELLEFSVFPILSLSYFFSLNLLNNGQSIGMNLLKIRVPTYNKGFYESFAWAAHSVVAVASLGLSLLLSKTKWKEVRSHDFLYSEFLAHKEHTHISLLERVELFNHQDDAQIEEDDFQIAA